MSVSGPGHWMDQMFQRKLNQFEMHPEDHLWEGIARKLDEEKRRAPWFGNWWTVLIASLIVVLVTGTGAYLYYKKQHKAQQVKPEINKDLPQQLPQHNNQDKGTATLPESNTGGNVYLVSNPPARQSVSED
ncbi:MAG TPA: hypothetical protein VFX48_03500, partial [Saprospiraceae bacterium]|nr:hypothetical protein [Saprospiraceae bacterium]